MHVISPKRIKQFIAAHPGADLAALDRWYRQAKQAEWHTFAEVRADFPSADVVGRFVVFNVGGNKYRLITEINYRSETLFLRAILTHAEYDQDTWKGA